MSSEYLFREHYLKACWARLCRDYDHVIIYGAGQHSRWLLENVIDDHSRIAFFLDDRAESGAVLENIPVQRPNQYLWTGRECVLISSDCFEKEMAARMKAFFPTAEVVEPYAAIGNGPFVCAPAGENKYPGNRERVLQYANRHRGERCFIVGNGPSLRKTDLSRLKGEVTFGVNRIYLLEKENCFNPSYYVCANNHVAEQFADEIVARVRCPKFFSVQHGRWIPSQREDLLFFEDHITPTFQTDLLQPIWIGATVTYVAMQIAYYMGFSEVVLIGVDHSFQTNGEPHRLVESVEDDPNHFSGGYFGKGIRWQLPDLETSELAYRMAKYAFEQDGRRVVDATMGGQLTIFPKVEYETLWERADV